MYSLPRSHCEVTRCFFRKKLGINNISIGLLLSIAKIVAPVISVTLFTQFATTATTLLNWFGDMEYPENIISLAFFCCQLVQILPCCLSASQLIADCERLPDAIFHCNWMDQDRRFRRAILFFLQRTQTPIRFSCLKLFDANLETSVAVGFYKFRVGCINLLLVN